MRALATALFVLTMLSSFASTAPKDPSPGMGGDGSNILLETLGYFDDPTTPGVEVAPMLLGASTVLPGDSILTFGGRELRVVNLWKATALDPYANDRDPFAIPLAVSWTSKGVQVEHSIPKSIGESFEDWINRAADEVDMLKEVFPPDVEPTESGHTMSIGIDNGTVGCVFVGGSAVCALLPLPRLVSELEDPPVPRTFEDVTVTDFIVDGLGQIRAFEVESPSGSKQWIDVPLPIRHSSGSAIQHAFNDGTPRDIDYLDHQYGFPEFVSMSFP